ncbi:MAG: hypothetical protein COX48_02305 [bacterium (Candidatus Stahlbacteria) CG23_combo_of_CG06-09_8_20_14_all_34_7]|nr:MAG: hypothetical protein COX48_02305 [bacterium (Candidatus Stahlbacteria) CG23_combo_of_CG06-09_8_20_14_all_34_7]
MKVKKITNRNLKNFAKKLNANYEIFYPQKLAEQFVLTKLDSEKEISLEGYRTLIPLKYIFYSPQENLIEKDRKPTIVFGARACDIRGLNLLKKIYLEDTQDPYYRDDVLIFSADCTSFHSSCFCTLLGDNPWLDNSFDLNFSPIENGYLVDIGSKRGEKFLLDYAEFFEEAKVSHEKERELKRTKIKEQLKNHNENKTLNLEKIKKATKENKSIFEEYGRTCVSCSSCTNVCPTCFCFFLSEGDKNKARYMDSCQFKGFARVAGGANPKEELITRFKNRFNCKFIYRPEAQESLGCTGCGRCIDVCQGKINYKEVLIKLGE